MNSTQSLNTAAATPDAFDIAEAILVRLRQGLAVDIGGECRDHPEWLDAVRSIVEAAAELEGLKDQSVGIRPNWRPGDASPVGYEIIREIARGGMGVVYEARQRQLNRIVAIKMVVNADPKALIRFLAEAEAIAAVRHPNVVQVYESGQHNGQPYLAMEFSVGGTLATKLKDAGKFAPKAAVELMVKVAAGVAAAHEEGVVHRDLKPGNVLFDAAGVPKVADFGLAKRGTGADLTHTIAVMGTPAYMSPEQARGETKFVGPQADVWALGVMLYECLTGSKPFEAENVMAILDLVKSGQIAGVRSASRDVPRDVELIVQKCLAKDPTERYPTAKELKQDLENWLAGRPISAKPAGAVTRGVKWTKRNKLPSLFGVLLLFGVLTSSWFAILAERRAESESIARRDAIENEKVANAAKEDSRLKSDELRTTAARAMILPLDSRMGEIQQSPIFAQSESNAIEELAQMKDEELRVRVLELGFNDPFLARQIANRESITIHSAIGLNLNLRNKCTELLEQQSMRASDETHFVDLYIISTGVTVHPNPVDLALSF